MRSQASQQSGKVFGPPRFYAMTRPTIIPRKGDHMCSLSLYSDLPSSKIESEIASTDAEIDRMVYDLYGLTEDEIAIVEDSAK